MDTLDVLKIYLQELKYPCFTDLELLYFLEENNNNPLLTASKLCVIKANNNKRIKVGPIEIEYPVADYWITLSKQYEEEYNKKNLGEIKTSYPRTLRRIDEC